MAVYYAQPPFIFNECCLSMAIATFSHHNFNAVNRNRDMCENDTTKSSTLMHKKYILNRVQE